MPTVPVYRTRETFQAAPAANPASVRLRDTQGIVSDLGQIGQGIDNALDLNRQRDEQQQKEAAAPVIASISPQMDLQLNDLLNNKRESMQPGAKGFASDFMKSAQPIYESLMKDVDNPAAKDTLSRMWQNHLASYGKQAQDMEAGERIGYQVNQLGQGINTFASLVGSDPSRYSESLEQANILIENSGNLTPSARRNLHEQAMANLTQAAADSAVERDPSKMVQWLTGAASVGSGDPSDPRGIRNNNPTNLRQSDNAWQGKVAGRDSEYETFSDPVSGIRAGMVNARNYQQLHGARTVREIVSRWAPKSENDTDAYAAGVAKGMGVSLDSPIDLNDHSTLVSLTKQLVQHENGKQPYSDETYAAAADSAISGQPVNSGAQLVAGDPHDSSPDFIRNLSPRQRQSYLDKAQSQVEKQNSKLRSYVSGRVQDDTAAMLNGYQVDQPLSGSQILQAYGDIEGPRVLRAYKEAQDTGAAVSRYATMTDAQIHQDIESAKPENGPGMADAVQDYGVRQKAAAAIAQQRNSDPITFAANAGLADVGTLNWTSTTDSADELKRRVGVAQMMSSKYGTPYQLLSTSEGAQLAQYMKTLPVERKMQILNSIRSVDDRSYDAVMSQVKINAPDIAMAGRIMASQQRAMVDKGAHWFSANTPTYVTGSDVAREILEGREILSPHDGTKTVFKLPVDQNANGMLIAGLKKDWTDATGKAYRSAESAATADFQAIQAIYAAKAARAGIYDGAYNKDIADQAIRSVVGERVDIGTNEVLAPWGMSADDAKTKLGTAWSAVSKGTEYAKTRLDALDLQPVGEGEFAVRGPLGPVLDKSGKPVIISIGGP